MMEDNRTIGQKIASAYRPFLASKPVGPVDETVNALAKDIDRNFVALAQQLKDAQDIAKQLYKELVWCYTVPACMDMDIKKAIDRYEKYSRVVNLINDADNRNDQGTTG